MRFLENGRNGLRLILDPLHPEVRRETGAVDVEIGIVGNGHAV